MAVMKRMILNFTPQEFDVIVDLAIAQHRDPRQQATYLIRQSLEHLGLLEPAHPAPQPQQEAQHERD